MTRYEGGFQVSGWDEAAFEDLGDDAKLAKVRIEQAFTGDLDATGAWDGIMYYRSDGTAVYSGIQTLTGRLDGREGSVVLVSGGEYDGTTATSAWQVVPGSGKDDWSGLSGSGESSAQQGQEGSYSLDVDVS